jgi:predicted  nucleic acid-binding Zn-ribbon protein
MKSVVILDTCEYEQLQKDLAKANEERDRWKAEIHQMRIEREDLERENRRLKTELSNAIDGRNAEIR